VAAIAGAGFGYAVGEPVEVEDILPARTLPADLCARLGDMSVLLPKASSGTAPVTLTQGGKTAVTCETAVTRQRRSYSAASVRITITPYAGQDAGAGNAPLTPAMSAKRAFDRSPLEKVPDRQYATRASRTANGIAGESWSIKALVQRADIVVQVEYTANPIEAETAEKTVLLLADRAIWETK